VNHITDTCSLKEFDSRSQPLRVAEDEALKWLETTAYTVTMRVDNVYFMNIISTDDDCIAINRLKLENERYT